MKSLGPLAQGTLAENRTKVGARPLPKSVTADKFVIRSTKDVIGVMEQLGDQNRRSVNSEIICAIVESLAGRKKATAIRKVLIDQLGQVRADLVLSWVRPLVTTPASKAKRKVIRFPDGVRASVTEYAERAHAEGGDLNSMHKWIADALLWWVNNQRECNALLSAIVELEDARTIGAPNGAASE